MEEDDPPSLQALLHKTAFDKNVYHADLTSGSAKAYLDHLISLPLSSLSREPNSISSEASTVEAELTNLCYREYPTFISVHKCSAAVRSTFDDFEHSLEQLVESVPVLEAECQSFVQRTHGIGTLRNRALLVQENQDKLIDLLEIPQLMETCVRNGYYQEAMDLATHAKSLHSRYPSVQLLKDTAKEAEAVMQLFFSQLLGLLREPVKLPTLVKVITYIRKSGFIDERSLGMVFLSSRLHNFRNQLVHVERDRAEPIRYLRKYIDLFREHVYDIVSQYTALFENSELLVSFANQCVTDLVRLVTSYVPRISSDSAALSSILVQLGYCSISFARIGLDFAALVSAPFAGTVLATYSQAVAVAADQLATTLKAALKSSTAPVDSLINQDVRSSVLASPPKYPSTHDQPPSVSHLPPIAVFLNNHLSALNALRLLAPTDIADQLAAIQSEALLTATKATLQFIKQASTASDSTNGERPKHARTPSSPRSHLLRRNTETQLSPGLRAIRRKETHRICLLIAQGWQAVVAFLLAALRENVFGQDTGHSDPKLEAKLAELAFWSDQDPDTEVNGHVTSETVKSTNILPVSEASHNIAIPENTLSTDDVQIDTQELSSTTAIIPTDPASEKNQMGNPPQPSGEGLSSSSGANTGLTPQTVSSEVAESDLGTPSLYVKEPISPVKSLSKSFNLPAVVQSQQEVPVATAEDKQLQGDTVLNIIGTEQETGQALQPSEPKSGSPETRRNEPLASDHAEKPQGQATESHTDLVAPMFSAPMGLPVPNDNPETLPAVNTLGSSGLIGSDEHTFRADEGESRHEILRNDNSVVLPDLKSESSLPSAEPTSPPHESLEETSDETGKVETNLHLPADESFSLQPSQSHTNQSIPSDSQLSASTHPENGVASSRSSSASNVLQAESHATIEVAPTDAPKSHGSGEGGKKKKKKKKK